MSFLLQSLQRLLSVLRIRCRCLRICERPRNPVQAFFSTLFQFSIPPPLPTPSNPTAVTLSSFLLSDLPKPICTSARLPLRTFALALLSVQDYIFTQIITCWLLHTLSVSVQMSLPPRALLRYLCLERSVSHHLDLFFLQNFSL